MEENTSAQVLYNPIVVPEIESAKLNERIEPLILDKLPLDIYIKDIDAVSPEEFTLARKEGFGGSDTGVLAGVNPYKTIEELIDEKARPWLTEREKATSQVTAVRKGNDLEPLIMLKFEKSFKRITVKPADMYVYKDYPWLKMNFDGVTTIDKDYIPVEIKVVTKTGRRHYNPVKAIFTEYTGFRNLPSNVSEANMTIEQKAAHYGIPPYYYTQLQDEIMALNAPYGFLAALLEDTWELVVFFVWKDQKVQNLIITRGYKAWEKVEQKRRILGTDKNAVTEPEEPLFIDDDKEEA